MKGRDTLANYVSQEDERVRVVASPIRRIGSRDRLGIRYFGKFTMREYVNDKLVEEYEATTDGFRQTWVPYFRPLLKQLAEAGASSDEVIAGIDVVMANLFEAEEIEVDEPDRFKEFE